MKNSRQTHDAHSRRSFSHSSSLYWRPALIILFAAILILISRQSKADDITPPTPQQQQTPSVDTAQADEKTVDLVDHSAVTSKVVSHASMTIELNGTTHTITAAPYSPIRSAISPHLVPGARQSWTDYTLTRPAYVQLRAELANFDADAAPDGWRAQVVVRDRRDRAISVRGHAEFQLTPRVPTGDFHNYIDANTRPLKWTKPLAFDENGVAHFKLPLREKLRPLFGWASAIYPESGLRSTIYSNQAQTHRRGVHRRYSNSRRLSTTVTGDWRNNLGKPDFGELRVKISVPSEGVFQAVTVMPIRPSVLVDTHWPYR